MRIAMLTNNYKPIVGGVPISVERLACSLRKRGHEVIIIAPDFPGQVPEAHTVRCRSLQNFLPGGMVLPHLLDPALEEPFLQKPFDLIHVHHPMLLGYTALYLSRKYNIPLAFTYHTRYEQYLHYAGFYRALSQSASPFAQQARHRVDALVAGHNRLFANRCDLVFAPTPLIRDYLRGTGVGAPVEIMPTGLDEDEFLPVPQEALVLRRQLSGGRRHLLCTVSRLEKEKNLGFLLESLALARQALGDSFRLVVMGDGSQRQELERQAQELGLGSAVTFTGNIPHHKLKAYYQACDLFLFASRSETQGIVLLEAMAAGLPVVAVEASGVCDVVRNGVNGWQTPEDLHSFASKTAELLTTPALFTRLGQGAAQTATGYRADYIAAQAERHYRDAMVCRAAASLGCTEAAPAYTGSGMRWQ